MRRTEFEREMCILKWVSVHENQVVSIVISLLGGQSSVSSFFLVYSLGVSILISILRGDEVSIRDW